MINCISDDRSRVLPMGPRTARFTLPDCRTQDVTLHRFIEIIDYWQTVTVLERPAWYPQPACFAWATDQRRPAIAQRELQQDRLITLRVAETAFTFSSP
jgi:hypothetical protein